MKNPFKHIKHDQRICFRYNPSTINSVNPKVEASSHFLCPYSPVRVGNSEDRISLDAAHVKIYRWFYRISFKFYFI